MSTVVINVCYGVEKLTNGHSERIRRVVVSSSVISKLSCCAA
jgi:hypothetical protein